MCAIPDRTRDYERYAVFGVKAPMALVFLGVIGGILAFGFLGLFIGPTLLTVAYNLFQDWMNTVEAQTAQV